MSGYSLSIDIGASTTVAALSGRRRARRTEPRLLDMHGHTWGPSAVYLDPERGLLAGVDAMRLAKVDPSRFEPHPKLRIDEGELLLGDAKVPIMDVLAAIIGCCVDRAASQNRGRRPETLVLTHPADWGSLRRHLLRRAGHRFAQNVRLIAEPLAAATRLHALGGVPPRTPIAVYDLGGGSLDVAVVGELDGRLAVLASDNLPRLGGAALDEALLRLVLWRARLVEPDQRTLASLREDVRLARESLPVEDVDIPLPHPLTDVNVAGADLEAALDPLLRRTVEALAEVIAAAGIAEPVVLLTGGASRMPQCTALIRELLGVEPVVLARREAAVCLGALTPGLAEPAGEPPPAEAGSAAGGGAADGDVAPVPGAGDGGVRGERDAGAAQPPAGRWRWRRVLLVAGLVAALVTAAAVAFGPFLAGDREVSIQRAQGIARAAIPVEQFTALMPSLAPPVDGPPVREGVRPQASSLLCADGTPPAPAERGGRLAAAEATLTEQLGQVRRSAQQLTLTAVYLTESAAGQLDRQLRDGVAACVRDGTGGLTNLRVLTDELDVPAGRSWIAFTGEFASAATSQPAPNRVVRVTCVVEITGRLGLRSCATTDQGQVATTLLAVRGLNAMQERVAANA